MDTIAILDFGGQYCHLILRRILDFGVHAEVLPSNTRKEDLKKISGLKGIILSGSAASVYDNDSPKCDKEILNIGVPVLGICYGHQLIAYLENGEVKSGNAGEYGVTELRTIGQSGLLQGLSKTEKIWMNHKDIVTKLPQDYSVVAVTDKSPIAVFENQKKKQYGVQFHPEVTHTENGNRILENFIFNVCNAKKELMISNIIENISDEIRKKIGNRKAIIALSGGVDSSTTAILVSRIIGEKLTAVYVDTGLMRHKETEFMEQEFSKHNLNLKIINAADRFFSALKNITEPEEKRKIIGKLFIDIFDEIAQQEKAGVLIQGTIYSDRIESGITPNSSVIKSHHNVGGLPEKMNLEVYEPLRDLYKNEVRSIAKNLGLSENIINRHVFPGPGLAIRIIGEVTPEKAEIVRKAGYIIEEELRNANLYNKVWMAFAVLLPIKSVGIQGDARSYKYPIVVRIIESKDAMTANFSKIPYEILEKISTRITNEINEVNRVVYDISNKPPATMEWE
ncbi:glutamine-hydrolyzing GMP synthase [Candidatus Woesearchaeota archaeon CG07_land_8_20_14_0_80_44_23]|nr:MAG: glutamine-hydrolyzing GMP synthase [Candidatus Woesearchaeota archaeon CG07_land_8_20_14_0_80_44_23]